MRASHAGAFFVRALFLKDGAPWLELVVLEGEHAFRARHDGGGERGGPRRTSQACGQSPIARNGFSSDIIDRRFAATIGDWKALAMRDLSTIRDQLKSRLETLNQRIGEIKGELRTAPSANWEEQATETQGDQVLDGVEGSALIEAQQVHAAIVRIDAGTYGS